MTADCKNIDEWQDISSAPEGVEVMTKIDDAHGERNVQSLKMVTRTPGETAPMWWYPDMSMYVYYRPTHWKPMVAGGRS
ncbi:hypothetical protein [Agrobacterium pusense]|uniref:hypothetical protein n=1 Tax=Agrobacterium pusense TaxID=648995 RepID=UPI0005146D04|nr:hypothetical protein [Agrobacterium pusense]ANV25010.1 hypothetical protein BA939_14395 [Rhizobium sp. S41]KGE79827.1 hypothetical protein LW14_26845 [Rhizobium sp. H41]QWW74186.1 hypothetical protein KP800_01390 [Agrobacterium pusense]